MSPYWVLVAVLACVTLTAFFIKRSKSADDQAVKIEFADVKVVVGEHAAIIFKFCDSPHPGVAYIFPTAGLGRLVDWNDTKCRFGSVVETGNPIHPYKVKWGELIPGHKLRVERIESDIKEEYELRIIRVDPPPHIVHDAA